MNHSFQHVKEYFILIDLLSILKLDQDEIIFHSIKVERIR